LMTLPIDWGEIMKVGREIFVLLLALGVALGLNSSGLAENEDLDIKINSANRKINILKYKENRVLGKLVQTQEEMDKLSTDLSKINNRVGTTKKKMRVIGSQLDKTQIDIEKVRGLLDQRKDVLNRRLVSLYKYGYQSYLEILFGVKDFSEFVSRFEMVGNFVNKDLRLLKTLQQHHHLIASKKMKISQYQGELERQKRVYDRLKSEAVKKHRILKTKANVQKRELTSIQSDREKMETALDELEEMSRAMESEIRRIQQSQSQTVIGSGRYIWPTVPAYRVTSGYGSRLHPILRKYRFHQGIDIGAPKGIPVVAADSGVVIWSGLKGGYGKTVMIDHGLGYSTVYGHTSVLLVKKGQQVTQGQRIALVGSTGLSTGPHLHFEIRKNGRTQNPMKYLK
jgi:murein DD-endopeptidase MepM/ murein hydrolase activator NlpD